MENTDERTVVDAFHGMYYDLCRRNEPPMAPLSWRGVPVLKCAEDLLIFQEIIHDTKPDLIIECGVAWGGSTLYLGDLCALEGRGEVIACDLGFDGVYPSVREHPRITLVKGSSLGEEVYGTISRAAAGRRTTVILDSDHRAGHVYREMKAYGELVTPGCYMIVEDSNVNGHPVLPGFGPGPAEAIEQFLREPSNSNWRVDRSKERMLLTFNPSGYLLKV